MKSRAMLLAKKFLISTFDIFGSQISNYLNFLKAESISNEL